MNNLITTLGTVITTLAVVLTGRQGRARAKQQTDELKNDVETVRRELARVTGLREQAVTDDPADGGRGGDRSIEQAPAREPRRRGEKPTL